MLKYIQKCFVKTKDCDHAETKVTIKMGEYHEVNFKISGYLEKRGKMKRLLITWKKYWFVLEGHLLLYYRSKNDYESLSPCKGSLTLGSACNVKPYSQSTLSFQINTRSRTIILRAENMTEHNKWMQAILVAVNQNGGKSPTKLNHFRYSNECIDVLHYENNSKIKEKETRKRKPDYEPNIRKSEPNLYDQKDQEYIDLRKSQIQKLFENYNADKQTKEKSAKSVEIMNNEEFCVCENPDENDHDLPINLTSQEEYSNQENNIKNNPLGRSCRNVPKQNIKILEILSDVVLIKNSDVTKKSPCIIYDDVDQQLYYKLNLKGKHKSSNENCGKCRSKKNNFIKNWLNLQNDKNLKNGCQSSDSEEHIYEKIQDHVDENTFQKCTENEYLNDEILKNNNNLDGKIENSDCNLKQLCKISELTLNFD